MVIRFATFVAVASAAAALGLAIPAAEADTPDQQFINLVHANGIPGQDESLIAYAHEFCNSNGPYWDTAPALVGQGVQPPQFYTLRVAASRAYCPNMIAMPNNTPPVFTGLVP
jgi:hypothetical protein